MKKIGKICYRIAISLQSLHIVRREMTPRATKFRKLQKHRIFFSGSISIPHLEFGCVIAMPFLINTFFHLFTTNVCM